MEFEFLSSQNSWIAKSKLKGYEVKVCMSNLKEDQNKPTFAYLAHTTVHTALDAPAELIQKYVDMGLSPEISPR